MNHHHNRAVTLLELLIAIVLLTVVVLGFSSIDLFSRYHLLGSERRAKVQNEASLVLEHMKKEVSKAIGDVNNPPVVSTGTRLVVWIDYNAGSPNGRRDPYPQDKQIAYEFIAAPQYQVRYYADSLGAPGNYEILSSKVSNFNTSIPSVTNTVYVNITVCWNPVGLPVACGSPENPSVNMNATIDMPSVSIH